MQPHGPDVPTPVSAIENQPGGRELSLGCPGGRTGSTRDLLRDSGRQEGQMGEGARIQELRLE